jgi:hypothetical protein
MRVNVYVGLLESPRVTAPPVPGRVPLEPSEITIQSTSDTPIVIHGMSATPDQKSAVGTSLQIAEPPIYVNRATYGKNLNKCIH